VGAILQALLRDIPEQLESERLVLRATRAGSGAAANAACVESQRELQAWMPWAREPQSVEQSEAHCRAMHAKWHSREELDFCFQRASDGLLVGKGGLHTIDWTVPKFEIGYWIRTSCTRNGYATEATLALVRLACSLGARRVEITADAANTKSRRVAERGGFVLEGILRQSRRNAAGELADTCMYARTF
jgi:RimJ/RimL family protein N-acetyltransferase